MLRLIGDPETRYREDPVRLLRAAPFRGQTRPGSRARRRARADALNWRHLLEDIPPARLFEEVTKLFLTGHAEQTMHALQRFGLTRYLFPVLEPGDGRGARRRLIRMLWQACAIPISVLPASSQ